MDPIKSVAFKEALYPANPSKASLKVNVASHEGNVMLFFNKPVLNVSFTPEQAREISRIFRKESKKAALQKKVNAVTPNNDEE